MPANSRLDLIKRLKG